MGLGEKSVLGLCRHRGGTRDVSRRWGGACVRGVCKVKSLCVCVCDSGVALKLPTLLFGRDQAVPGSRIRSVDSISVHPNDHPKVVAGVGFGAVKPFVCPEPHAVSQL